MLRKLIALALAVLMGTAALPSYSFAAAASPVVVKKTETVKQQAVGVAKPGQSISTSTTERTTTVETKPAPSKSVLPPAKAKPGTKVAKRTPRPLPYHAFCKGGLPSQEELAIRLAESINANASGKKRLRGCMATAVQFLEAFKKGADRSELTLADLPRYVREDLEETEIDHSVTWMSSCVRGKSLGADDVKMDCMREKVPAGVKVLRDKKTGRIAIKLDCANPGLVPAEQPPCAYVLFHVTAPGRASPAAFGRVTEEEETLCPISIEGPRQDGEAFGPENFRQLSDEVENPCDWTDIQNALGLPLHRAGCVRVAPGWYLLRVPARFATTEKLRAVLCLELDDGSYTDGMGVMPNEYRRQKDRSMLAIIWSSEDVIPKGFSGTDLWWRWVR